MAGERPIEDIDSRLYAVLGSRLVNDDWDWQLPEGKAPGDWMPRLEGPLTPYKNGYPLCKGPMQLLRFPGPEIYVAEVDGEVIETEFSIHARRVRLLEKTAWDDRAARFFAIECAERVLPVFEKVHTGDDRPRLGLSAARAFLDGEITLAAVEKAAKAVSAAAWNASIINEDLLWGTSIEEVMRHSAAGSPTTVAYWAASAARSATHRVADNGNGNGSMATRSAAQIARLAAAPSGNCLSDPAETRWQVRRFLEYLSGEN